MKTNHRNRTLPLVGALLCATAASAQPVQSAAPDSGNQTWDPFAPSHPQDQKMEKADPASLNRITGSLRFGLNISGKFNGVGAGFNPYGPGYPTTTPDGKPYNYGDGYVNPDISGNTYGVTWNYGYDAPLPVNGLPGQVNLGSSTINMDNTIAGSGTSSSQDIDNDPGFEFTYNRELGIVQDWHNMHYGLEAAFNYLPVSYNVTGTYSENMVSTPYFLAGGAPPGYNSGLLYRGSFGNPGNVIGATPSGPNAVTPIPGSSLSVNDNYSGDLWGFRLGPYVEWPVGEKFSLHLSGGLALGILDGNASWSEKLTLPNGVQSISGGGNDTSLLFGGYISGAAEYQFNERWDVEAAVQFQDLGTYDHNFSGRGVQLDLSQSVFILVGVSYHF